jgi:hypothetical protein
MDNKTMNLISKEVWKDIKGFEGLYQVSNLGNVKSLERIYYSGEYYNIKKLCKTIILKGGKDRYGYIYVKFNKNKSRKNFYIHRLVIEHFLRKIPKGLTVNHIDGNKLNNAHSNLEICTSKENRAHAIKLGLVNVVGEKNPRAKLTTEDVLLIRSLKDKKTVRELQSMFTIGEDQIRRILKRQAWKHI